MAHSAASQTSTATLPVRQQGMEEGIAGALAPVAPVPLASGAVGVMPPRSHGLTLASGPLPRTRWPPQGMEGGAALCAADAVGEI